MTVARRRRRRSAALGAVPLSAPDPGLVNVAPRGLASQSSTSRWSRPDDAAGALLPHAREFGFHTGLEADPWWLLRLDRPYRLDRVVIHNRRTALQNRAEDLVVEISVDGAAWSPVHRGSCRFGNASHGGSPLTLRLPDRPEARFLRLGVHGRTYLHLGWIEVWAKEEAARPVARRPEMLFLAARGDGFGARLRALLNAIILADHFGGQFRVAWEVTRSMDEPAHAVLPAERTFSQRFLELHLLQTSERRRGFVRLRNQAMLDAGTSFKVDPYPLERVAPGIAACLPREAGRAAFRKVRFAENLERAREAALDLDLPPATSAIHLRAGDIIYGPYRLLGHFAGKAIPYPLALGLIRRLRSRGKAILIFGQDSELCRHIAREDGILFTGDISDGMNFDKYQSVLFDISLMSRCQDIFAGESAFATVASQIAGIPIERPQDRLGPRDIRRLLREPDPAAAISDRQRAFALWHAIYLHRGLFDAAETDEFLDRAIELDPDNVLYRLVRIRTDLLNGHVERAGRVLYDLAESEAGRSGLVFSLTERRLSRNSLPKTVVESFRDLGEAGHSGALLCIALAATEAAQARAAGQRFLKLRPASLGVWDEEVRRAVAAARGPGLAAQARRMLAS